MHLQPYNPKNESAHAAVMDAFHTSHLETVKANRPKLLRVQTIKSQYEKRTLRSIAYRG